MVLVKGCQNLLVFCRDLLEQLVKQSDGLSFWFNSTPRAPSAPTLGIHRQPWRVSVPPQPCCPDPTRPREPCRGGRFLRKTGVRAALFRFLGSRYRLILASAPTPLRTGGPSSSCDTNRVRDHNCCFLSDQKCDF